MSSPRTFAATTLCLALALAGTAAAQEDPERDELEARIEQLEERLRQLEADDADEAESEGEGGAEGEDDPPETPTDDEEPPPTPTVETPTLEPPEATGEPADEEEGLVLELPMSMELSFGGSLRFRADYRAPADYRVPGTFGRPATADPDDALDVMFLRTRIHFDLRVAKPVRVFVELQDARTFGDTPVTTDTAEVHVRQAYAELDLRPPLGVPLSVRAGRLPVPTLGGGRLFCDPGFNNIGRSWDGAQVTWEPEGFWVTAFAANLRESLVFSLDGDENDDFWLTGVYASFRGLEGHELDAFLIWRHFSDRVFTSERSPRLGDRKDFTLGARVAGHAGPVGYSGDVAWQWGDQAGDRIRAWGGILRTWIKLDLGDGAWFRIAAEYAYASGDRDPDDGKLQTFDQIFGFRFKHYGRANIVAWQNSHIATLATTLSPVEDLSLNLDGHVYWLDKRKDVWFAGNQRPVRRDPTGAADGFLGVALDVYVRGKLFERVHWWFGYSHFFDGPYVKDTGKSEDQAYAYALIEVKF